MGYGKEAPAKYAREYTDIELACKRVSGPNAATALTVIGKLTKNVAQNPTEEKYRKIRLSNPKIEETIVNVPGAMDLLIVMGWEYNVDEDADHLILPAKVKLQFQRHARPCDEFAELIQKEQEKQFMRKATQPREVTASDKEKEALRAQMEADRKERAAQGPITQASVRTERGEGKQMGCADAGIGCSSGG